MEKPEFYEDAGYSKYYYPDEVKTKTEIIEEPDAKQES